ncbi:MAG: glycosyltransferase family 4 protein [Candidatus Tectomicrobia bacterium]|nr:glycosyltransferase family 4 protein [Candidatus Tectomicrobia bacterium]
MSPKRIGICTAQVPFTTGGAEMHVRNLEKALIEHGYEAEIIAIPFQSYPPMEIAKNIFIWRLLDITQVYGKKIDLVIAVKFPAYFVRHPNKVLWILHQHRIAYDLWATEYCDLIHLEGGVRVRDIIIHADTMFLPEAKKIYALSKTVTERLKKFNNLSSEPLYAPPPNVERLFCRGYSDYIFSPSRLESIKRQDLLIEAMTYVKTNVKCYIAGTGPFEQSLRKLIAQRKLENKVKLLGFLSEEELIQYYVDALAVFFGPFREDYGYVTLEALYSKKAVITLTDSGGPLEFIKDGINGSVVSPEPEAIAEAIDCLFQDKSLARKMGEQGFQMILDQGISWENVVRKLVL